MQRYIEHLIEDLEEAANNPPAASFIEPPLHLEEDQETSELALVPFKSIEEWTGIKQEVFPEINELQGDQWGKVNEAIIKVFESLKLELVDVPPEIPPEWLYEVLSTNWNHPVQYLPSSGMDLELCTGDPMTCPYGEYCTCGDDLIEDDIPERFKKVIPEIAQSIDAGFVCFLNPETMEIEEIRQRAIDDPEEYEAITGVILENEEYKHQDWDSVFEFEPLDSNESFRIMEAFTAKLSDKAIQNRLIYALNHRKPFANFKSIIDNSIFRQDWFDFKQQWLENHVKELLSQRINESYNFPPEEINGFFNDDGTKIDPESIPVPGLCIICKKHNANDRDENILCHLNRNDQKDDDDFICDSFEKI